MLLANDDAVGKEDENEDKREDECDEKLTKESRKVLYPVQAGHVLALLILFKNVSNIFQLSRSAKVKAWQIVKSAVLVELTAVFLCDLLYTPSEKLAQLFTT